MTSEFNGWGYKCAWFAVRSTDPSAVAECLQLSDVSSEPIGDVTDKTYERDSGYVAVIGPIDGWCLAPFDLILSDDLRMLDLVGALSIQFGEAQLFTSYRVVSAYQFERWMDGTPIRQVYVADGEVFRNHGEPDGFETSLLDINEDVQHDEVDDDNFGFAMSIDEDTVLAMAEEWSVDPLSLPERDDLPPFALVGLSPFRDKTGRPLSPRPFPKRRMFRLPRRSLRPFETCSVAGRPKTEPCRRRWLTTLKTAMKCERQPEAHTGTCFRSRQTDFLNLRTRNGVGVREKHPSG